MMEQPTTQLFTAANNNDTVAIKATLQAGADLEAKDAEGRTPLMVATYKHHFDAANTLVQANANVNAQDKILNSPFLYAGASGFADLVQLYMQHGARYDVFNRYGGTALIPACERAHLPVIELLLADKNFPVNHVNNLGWTALMEAVILGNGGSQHTQVVKRLLDAGVAVNIPDKEGITPYRHAMAKGYTKMAELLKAAGGK
ncbi:hypothetical protein LX64_04199 [Chitinophaga skermanii]|uniref:Uncharacterized protein n=2 Tax=Chitinophaga skermanii TaxID=331697 RepID=A0A327QA56_9BACT|nr:hypothetical protein LX64_04199 [Chitinophaga skermanii]